MTNEKQQFLVKNKEFQYDSDNIFKNDALDRRIIIENLSNLLWSADQSFVVSIESSWGTGKTVFVNLWKLYLEKNDTSCIYFNAWENDFYSDPIIPFIGCFDEFVNKEIKNVDGAGFDQSLEKIKKIGGTLVKKSIPVFVKIASQGLVDLTNIDTDAIAKEVPGLVAEIAEESIENFEKKKNEIKILQQNIEKVAKKIIEVKKKRAPLVFFIDELDRCKPDFAILLLERLKHIFSVEDVVFVLSVDRGQLENSVKAIYGNNIEASGYLLRFIDYRFKLPEIKSEINFYRQLFEKYQLKNLFSERIKSNQNYEINDFEKQFLFMVKFYKLSLREMEKLFTEINLFIRILPINTVFFPSIIFYFLISKLKDGEFFEKIADNRISVLDFEKHFEKHLNMLVEPNEKYLLGFLQGMIFKHIENHENNSSKEKNPIEYFEINNDDKYKFGKFSGYKYDSNQMFSIKAVIHVYFDTISLIQEIKI
ncbi:MAG: KAP family NTPase [Deltaproteobacteria bacterium]|nr:KAP family NTPase [Deltaproteobacteria bacterium]